MVKTAKKKFPADRNEVGHVDLTSITKALFAQGTVSAADAKGGFDPQLQFILTNRHYAASALAAIKAGKVEAAHIMPTGMGGYSFEVQCSDETVASVRATYNRECDALGLY